MLPIIFAAKFLQLLPHLLHSDNDQHDPEEIFCQMQEILHLQTISLKFDRTAEQKLEKLLQDKDPEKIQKACKNLGAEFTETKADLCAVFPVLPRYPVTLKIWFADEEFPASGKLFLQDHADHYLSVEDAVTVGEILLQKLSEAFSSL